MKLGKTGITFSEVPKAVRDELRAAVRLGASALDKGRPKWFKQVNRKHLDLSSGCLCVIGQLYDDGYSDDAISKALRFVRGKASWSSLYAMAAGYGFTLPGDGSASEAWLSDGVSGSYGPDSYIDRNRALWRVMDHYWKLEIRERRKAAGMSLDVEPQPASCDARDEIADRIAA